jgi:hypothetical protein
MSRWSLPVAPAHTPDVCLSMANSIRRPRRPSSSCKPSKITRRASDLTSKSRNHCSELAGIDSLLDPGGDGNGADASFLSFEIRQHPSALSLLDGFDVEPSHQLGPPQGAANQQRQDHVIAFALQGRAGMRVYGRLLSEIQGRVCPCSQTQPKGEGLYIRPRLGEGT